MEKLFRTLISLAALCIFTITAFAQQNLIDIPDSNFRTALKAIPALSGSFVGDRLNVNSEAVKELMDLNLDSLNISNHEGLQYFTGLRLLRCSFNKLTTLPELPTYLFYLECDNNLLAELPALPGLSVLACGNNRLTSLPALPSSLDSLNCSNNLITAIPTLPPNINWLICNNNKLFSLPQLPRGLYGLVCSDNAITCLPFLSNNLGRLVTDNSLCLPNIPNNNFSYYDGEGNSLSKTLCNDYNNPNTCHQYPYISGRVYIDNDKSDTYTEGDFVLPKIIIESDLYSVESNSEGNYQLSFEILDSAFTVRPKLPLGFTATPDSYYFSFNSYGDRLINQDFSITTEVVNDLSVSFVGLGRTAPGFATSYIIVIKNNGSTVQNANLTFGFDSHLVFVSSKPMAASIGNTLSWIVSNLEPFQEQTFAVSFDLPASVVLGTELSSTVSVNQPSGEATPGNNTQTITQIVRGSYDPNDKQVDKGASVTPAQIAAQEDFNYTVRFQNTGTDTAYTVVIRDTLSTLFDISTLETVSASHNYSFSMKDNAAAWTFNNIKLPDSIIDKAGSNGFVRYKIKPKTTVQLNDELTNTAHIYFDFNEAVVTNTTVTKVAETTTGVEDNKLENSFYVYPNPGKGVFNIDFTENETVTLDVLSLDGRVITSLTNINGHTVIDLTGQSTGVYFLRVTSANLSEVRKLILE